MISLNWLEYAVLAAVCWGIYIVLLKYCTNPNYLNSHPSAVFLSMLVGITIVSGLFLLLDKQPIQVNSTSFWISIIAGMLWAVGMVCSLLALNVPTTEVARLTPIYNINAIIAVLISFIALHEAPLAEHRIKILTGTVLIVIGAYLVSS